MIGHQLLQTSMIPGLQQELMTHDTNLLTYESLEKSELPC